MVLRTSSKEKQFPIPWIRYINEEGFNHNLLIPWPLLKFSTSNWWKLTQPCNNPSTSSATPENNAFSGAILPNPNPVPISNHIRIFYSTNSRIACSLRNFISHTRDLHKIISGLNNYVIFLHSVGAVNLDNDLILENVLYIPNFHVSLISESSIIQYKISVHFSVDSLLFQDHKTLKTIGKGDLVQGLCLYNSSEGFFSASTCSSSL